MFTRFFTALAVFTLVFAWCLGQWAGANPPNPTTTTSSTSTTTSTSTTSTTAAPPPTVPVPPPVDQPPPPVVVPPAAPVQPTLPETGGATTLHAALAVALLLLGAGIWALSVHHRPVRRGSRKLMR